MPVERAAGGTSLIDVLDRVLDKGIVIDAWVRVSLVGIDLITVEARIVVASIDTYLKYSEAVGQVTPVSKPAVEGKRHEEVIAENAALPAHLNPGTANTHRSGRRDPQRVARRVEQPARPWVRQSERAVLSRAAFVGRPQAPAVHAVRGCAVSRRAAGRLRFFRGRVRPAARRRQRDARPRLPLA